MFSIPAMDDFLSQRELKTEPLKTESGLITSVDFFGDERRCLCIASADMEQN